MIVMTYYTCIVKCAKLGRGKQFVCGGLWEGGGLNIRKGGVLLGYVCATLYKHFSKFTNLQSFWVFNHILSPLPAHPSSDCDCESDVLKLTTYFSQANAQNKTVYI